MSEEMEFYYVVKGERHDHQVVSVAASIEELQGQLTHHLASGDIQQGEFRVLTEFGGTIEIKLNPVVTVTPVQPTVAEAPKKPDTFEDDIPF